MYYSWFSFYNKAIQINFYNWNTLFIHKAIYIFTIFIIRERVYHVSCLSKLLTQVDLTYSHSPYIAYTSDIVGRLLWPLLLYIRGALWLSNWACSWSCDCAWLEACTRWLLTGSLVLSWCESDDVCLACLDFLFFFALS